MKRGFLPCNGNDVQHSFPYFLSRRLHGFQGRQDEYWEDPLYSTIQMKPSRLSPGGYCSILALDVLFDCAVIGCCWQLTDWMIPWSEPVQQFLGHSGVPWGYT